MIICMPGYLGRTLREAFALIKKIEPGMGAAGGFTRMPCNLYGRHYCFLLGSNGLINAVQIHNN